MHTVRRLMNVLMVARKRRAAMLLFSASTRPTPLPGAHDHSRAMHEAHSSSYDLLLLHCCCVVGMPVPMLQRLQP